MRRAHPAWCYMEVTSSLVCLESHLRLLLTKQRKQVEDIKKATNYDSTRKLIERYDEMGPGPGPGQQPGMSPGGPSTPQRGQPQPQTPTRQAKGGTPRAPGHLAGAGGTPVPGRKCLAHGVAVHTVTKLRCVETPGTPIPIPEGLTAEQAAALQMQMQAIQPVLPTPEKKWYDRVVDSILGDDPCECISSRLVAVCTSIPHSFSLIPSEPSLTPRCSPGVAEQVCVGVWRVFPAQWSRWQQVRVGTDACVFSPSELSCQLISNRMDMSS